MRDRKRKSKPENETNSAIGSKRRRTTQSFLEAAKQEGPEAIEKANRLLSDYDTAIRVKDADAILLSSEKMASSKSVWITPALERGERDKQDRDRGNRARTASYNARDQKIQNWFDEIFRAFPNETRKRRIALLRDKLADHINWATDYGEVDDEQWARKWLLSAQERKSQRWLISTAFGPSGPVTQNDVLSESALEKILSKKLPPTASC